MPRWVPKLSDLFREAGLVAVEADVREAPPHLGVGYARVQLAGFITCTSHQYMSLPRCRHLQDR